MYITTHRIARIRRPDESSNAAESTSVHGYVYSHGDGFSLEEADIEKITTRDPGGDLVGKRTPGLRPGGNAVVSFLDIVAVDSINRASLVKKLASLERMIEEARDLPVEQSAEASWLKYHISPQGYREKANWIQDFRDLRASALELFDLWAKESP